MSVLVKNTDEQRKITSGVNLLADFGRIVEDLMPGFIVVENVPGISRNSESPLVPFKALLHRLKYKIFFSNVIDASTFGVPQSRKRFILIASRLTEVNITFKAFEEPTKNKVRDYIMDPFLFPPLEAGEKSAHDSLHLAARLSANNLKRIALTPKNGGTRESWSSTQLQIPAYKERSNGFRDVYGRMSWDRPAPTITTRFNSLSNGRFGHPEQNRAISLREGAILQTFPQEFVFVGQNQNVLARQIGNAVPPKLAKQIGAAITNSYMEWQTSGLKRGR